MSWDTPPASGDLSYISGRLALPSPSTPSLPPTNPLHPLTAPTPLRRRRRRRVSILPPPPAPPTMTLTIPEDVRAKAEIYVGDAAGQEKTRFLLQETGLPSGLLPLKDIVECGYVEETGFVWLKQRRKVDHYFARAGRHVSYGAEVSAVAEKGRLKKITGVKAKEMLIWVTLHEICVDDPPQGKLHCKAIGGLSRSFPVEAFEADGPPPAAAAAAARAVDVAANGNGNGAAAKEEVAAKKEGAVEEEKKEDAPAAAGEEKKTKEEEEKGDTAAAIDKVEEKLKEMSTEVPARKHADAVAAKN
ncbi:hypothetical protein GQ55_3G437300 [Panicum hallii var. hallii]|uniref:Uncharacterized protein n=1 Tax=Panicum hallii var. hallii TaxID=1504633 RepID=A0A2T7EI24_9POAL|nr:hypothetical protein GQ55_3G437300 [Panicum hallii var. hallii]